MQILDIILHLDQHLIQWALFLGPWLYVLLFMIIFAETGLVVTPFLPGDSLLFALGAITSLDGNLLSIEILSVLLVLAAFTGDNVNYQLGKFFGPKLFSRKDSKLFDYKHLERTQNFYDKHGTHAVVLARFVPILRTFVPFVAGIGKMPFAKYLIYSIGGAILWTQIFLWAGRIFGQMPSVKSNFHIVIFAVIGLSLVPIVIGWLRARKAQISQ